MRFTSSEAKAASAVLDRKLKEFCSILLDVALLRDIRFPALLKDDPATSVDENNLECKRFRPFDHQA